ncbi:hypothetical protein [Leifsonia sp. AG29]|uniref:hypothetical protein n=1 Tax=Leifsonia sp. AG29 TaxID=2598860 RepID=UPI00131C1822|nr:hypothetical protein [Leifsonia sp. AG29]
MSTEFSGADAEHTDVIDPSTFDKTLALSDVATRLTVDDVITFPWFRPIDTISPVHTVGEGRTNLTLLAPDILQTDTTGTPYAGFSYRDTLAGGPGVSVHFTPSAYGITATGTYIVSFHIATSGGVDLAVAAYTGGPGTSAAGTGNRTVSGTVSVVVALRGVPAGQTTWVSVQQKGGGSWQWFSTSIEYPPLVIKL